MKHYRLREEADPQTYAIGLKEVWEVSWMAVMLPILSRFPLLTPAILQWIRDVSGSLHPLVRCKTAVCMQNTGAA